MVTDTIASWEYMTTTPIQQQGEDAWNQFAQPETLEVTVAIVATVVIGEGVSAVKGKIENGLLNDGGRAVNPFIKGLTPQAGTRATGVARAAILEIELVQKTGRGTTNWIAEEIQYIQQTGRLPAGTVGHHSNSVVPYAEWAGDPRNIMFVRGQPGNLLEHGGNFTNSTMGSLIDRQAMLDALH